MLQKGAQSCHLKMTIVIVNHYQKLIVFSDLSLRLSYQPKKNVWRWTQVFKFFRRAWTEKLKMSTIKPSVLQFIGAQYMIEMD